jgi:hypothetical protein
VTTTSGIIILMSSDPLSLVLSGYGAMVLVMLGLWAVQLRTRNASIADVGFCFGLIAVVLWCPCMRVGLDSFFSFTA